MKGRSHTGANVFSAVVINNAFHVVDRVYSWHQLEQLLNSPQLHAALQSSQLLHKVTFYGLVALTARWPDVDQRVKWIGRLAGGHRGCTHSCLSVLLFIMLAVSVSVSLPIFLLSHHLIVSPSLLQEMDVIFKSIAVGWLLHLLADSLTRSGIPVFWPVTFKVGFPPVSALRFKTGSLLEDIVLWSIIFLVGFGIGAGLLGL